MNIKDKILQFFTYEEDEKDIEIEKEKISLKKELMEERKKYAIKKEIEQTVTEQRPPIESVEKQVMFVDETFERKEKHVEKPKTSVPKYTSVDERRFKPSSYISPVHGLIKPADEVEEYRTESKTISESDYSKIRDKAFGNDVFLEEEPKEKESKFFETSEIIDLQKRMQVDGDHVMTKDLTVDEAYKRAELEGQTVNNKTFTEPEENPQYLFDLLDELKEETPNE